MSDLSNVEEKMQKTVSVFSEQLSEVRAGRANPAILNKINISYYGVLGQSNIQIERACYPAHEFKKRRNGLRRFDKLIFRSKPQDNIGQRCSDNSSFYRANAKAQDVIKPSRPGDMDNLLHDPSQEADDEHSTQQ